MDRREAIRITTAIFGGMIVGGEAFLSGCESKNKSISELISEEQINLLNEIGETIIPESTSSDGAKAAKVGQFMKAMINDCYNPNEKKIFLEGLQQIEKFSIDQFNNTFLQLTQDQKAELLMELEKESSMNEDLHYYTLFKQLTVLGFVTSEVGQTKAMRYEAVPGRYDACISYKEGDKVWA